MFASSINIHVFDRVPVPCFACFALLAPSADALLCVEIKIHILTDTRKPYKWTDKCHSSTVVVAESCLTMNTIEDKLKNPSDVMMKIWANIWCVLISYSMNKWLTTTLLTREREKSLQCQRTVFTERVNPCKCWILMLKIYLQLAMVHLFLDSDVTWESLFLFDVVAP